MDVFKFVVIIISSASFVAPYLSFWRKLPSVDTTECAEEPECDEWAKYRTIDGSCSNLEHPVWGQANRPFVRIKEARYADGKSKLRQSEYKIDLPSVRKISSKYFHDHWAPDKSYTSNVMQWGQVIAHDCTHNVPNTTTVPGKMCCTTDNSVPPPDRIPENCIPIKVPFNDHFYQKFHVSCLNFSRATPAQEGICHKYPIEQMNSVSPVMDASHVYGSDKDTARKLRYFHHGKLNYRLSQDGRQFLPDTENSTIPCFNSTTCNLAGDDRVNQNNGITIYQIMFMRLHNHICEELFKINPHWNDEKLYQESRRIVGAIVQKITYIDWLSIILGDHYLNARGMNFVEDFTKCVNYYDPKRNPSTMTEFGGAAYRSFHSLVDGHIWLVDKLYKPKSFLYMQDYFFKADYIEDRDVMDMCMRGLVSLPQQSMDRCYTRSLTQFLFKFNNSWGNDLESTDFMRGREMGLPTYNEMREVCGLGKANSFDDLRDVMSEEMIHKLEKTYKSVHDMDLLLGGVLEEKIEGTLVGPTNLCIIGEQFYNYMRGDRFFFRNCGFPWSFTKEQQKAISLTSLAWIFCLTGDNIGSIPLDTFRHPSSKNPIVPCQHIRGLDLAPWKECP